MHAVELYYVYEVHIWMVLQGLDRAIDLCRCFVMVTGLQWEHSPMTSMQTTGHRDLVNCLRYGSRTISSLVQRCFGFECLCRTVLCTWLQGNSCHMMYMCLHVHVPPPTHTHTLTHHLKERYGAGVQSWEAASEEIHK